MAYGFDFKNIGAIEGNRQLEIWRFNLALNHALLSGDTATIRRFYQMKASTLSTGDGYTHREIHRSFFYNARPKDAFAYVGIMPWITESMVRLVASSGFTVKSTLQADTQEQPQEQEPSLDARQQELDAELARGVNGDGLADIRDRQKQLDKERSEQGKEPILQEPIEQHRRDIDEYAKHICETIGLQEKFERGVWLESGLGDFAFRISYDESVSNMPIVDVIEPQNIEPHFRRGKLYKIVIKDCTDEVSVYGSGAKHLIEMHETYTKLIASGQETKIVVEYSFWEKDKKLTDNQHLYTAAKRHWGIDKTRIELPFKDFPIVYKQNSKTSNLYRHERGVPDIHGIDTIEDALAEALSSLITAIRKSKPKTVVDPKFLSSDIKGNLRQYSDFDGDYILGGGNDDINKLYTVLQSRVDYQSYTETVRVLISHAINKAGLSPTTLGVTGLESINSSSESQDAREKPSLRTRKIKLEGWKRTLEELLNKYFMYVAWKQGEPILDYSSLLDVTFNEYINPSTENVLQVIAQAVAGRVYSVETGVVKVFEHEDKDYSLDDIIVESARIKGITPEDEMVQLGLIQSHQILDGVDEQEPKSDQQDLSNDQAVEGNNNNAKGQGAMDNGVGSQDIHTQR